MIFSTQCPSCEATFPIDSAKVPDSGVYARCTHCEGVFLVEVPAATPAVEAAATPVVEMPPVEPEVETLPVEVEVETAPVVELPPEPVAEVESAAEVEEPVAEQPETATAPPTFGKRDPNERAQRLARVLVSDMIAYHPDRHRRSLEEGTLKDDFDEEVEKSWNEYVDQVGRELANGTTYFTDALNEILAKGDIVF